jgi:ATP-dependent DNA ligase
VFLYAFELIELNGDDLRTDLLEIRKATLANVLAKVVGERPSLERGIGRSPSYSQRATYELYSEAEALMQCEGARQPSRRAPIPRPDLWQRHQDRGESWPR